MIISGYVNKKNIWSLVNPKEVHELPLHSPKVIVWCLKLVFWGFRPTYNEEDVAVNAKQYVTMLGNFVEPHLQRLGIDTKVLHF